MPYSKERLNPWVLVRLLPNMQRITVGQFRNRSDADGHLEILRLPESLIVKVEPWLYVLFVHRLDKGGQFISYRQMEQWKNAVACQLQKCSTLEQLHHTWNAITYDHTQHNKQYIASVFSFLERIWLKCLKAIPKEPYIGIEH